MKKILLFVVVLVVALLALNFTKDAIARSAVEGACRAITGLELKMGGLNFSISKARVAARDIRLFNPRNFKDRIMVDMSELVVDVDPSSIGGGKTLHVEEIGLDLKELVVVKGADGKLNLHALKSKEGSEKKQEKAAQPSQKKAAPQVRIDLLRIHVGRVVYKDYSRGGEPSVKQFDLNLNETHRNITNVQALVPLIMQRAILNTAVGSIVKLDMSSMISNFDLAAGDLSAAGLGQFSSLTSTLGGTATDTGEAAGDAVGKAAKGVASLFGSLGSDQ